VKFHTFITRL